jgi:hypothetical protein
LRPRERSKVSAKLAVGLVAAALLLALPASVGQLFVFDGGTVADPSARTPFMVQGLFVP